MKILSRIKKKELLEFISKIEGKEFFLNKNINNAPWKYRKLKNFAFRYVRINNQIVASLVIIKTSYSNHLSFLYILKNKRNKKIGSKLLSIFENYQVNKKLKTVHVTKTLKNSLKFYQKRKYIKIYRKNYILLNRWKKRCLSFDKNTFKTRYLLFKII